MKTKYVAGLMFRNACNTVGQREVALILKDHPAWQAGKLNAIGGKIDGMETPLNAMIREFAEETGSETKADDWREFCVLGGKDWSVHFFACLTGDGKELKTAESEKVGWYPLWQLLDQAPSSDPRLRVQTISNLKWLIPLALDKDGVFAQVDDQSVF